MNHKDYSYINNLDDLKKEITVVKRRIRNDKLQLEERWHNLPGAVVKRATGSLSPLLFSKRAWTVAGFGFGALKRLITRKKKVGQVNRTYKTNKMSKIKLFAALALAGFVAYRIIKRKKDRSV